MFYVGIDVAKDKHDCIILNSESQTLVDVFTIANNAEGFNQLLQTIQSCNCDQDKIKVGLEATGHYSYNILGFLLDKGLPTYVVNPLHTNLYRQGTSLRKTKTDRIDAKTIATMLMPHLDLKPYTKSLYHNEELKALTRYRFRKVEERSKIKQSISRLVTILFPELERLFSSIHLTSIYALLTEFPGAKQIAGAHLTRLTHLLQNNSQGQLGRTKAILIRDTARVSIGSNMPVLSLELKQTIQLVNRMDEDIKDIEREIAKILKTINSPITTIPGVGDNMAAMILAEIGDFSRFDSPDKILAYAGMSPSVYQSGKLTVTGAYSRMEKRGSKYLRYALYNATRCVCFWEPTFKAYLNKKIAEGKHYNIAISHAAKKLVRWIYAMEKTKSPYKIAA